MTQTVSQRRLGLPLADIRPATLSASREPALLVVVDTEEEFDWARPFDRQCRATTAIQGLVPLQAMLESVGARPTYVIDHPVATTPASAMVLRRFAESGRAEIGAHLHPWVTPPDEEPVNAFNSYAGNLAPALERAKLVSLVAAIEQGVGVRARTFKAGRYGIAPHTVQHLRELGFLCDLSSSPWCDWSGDGGPDFRGYRNDPYWLPGEPDLLEIPTTSGYFGPLRGLAPWITPVDNRPDRGAALGALLRRARLAQRAMLTPEGFGLSHLKALALRLIRDGHRVLTLSFHSPSVVPGHTPFVRDDAQLVGFMQTMHDFVAWARRDHGFVGMTARELREALDQG
jgi:hypothetical protein